MNKQEIITKFGKAVANITKVLESTSDTIEISFNSLDGVFFESCTYAEMLVELHKIRHNIGTGYKLYNYHLSNSNVNGKYQECLCVVYQFPEIEGIHVYFYLSDKEASLELIGKGKCKIKEETTKECVVPARTSRSISCDL